MSPKKGLANNRWSPLKLQKSLCGCHLPLPRLIHQNLKKLLKFVSRQRLAKEIALVGMATMGRECIALHQGFHAPRANLKFQTLSQRE
jgi:hypothetical protein